MLLDSLRRAFTDLFSPHLMWTVVKSVVLSLVVFALLWTGAWWLILRSDWLDVAWLNHTLHILGGLAVMVVTLLLFPSLFGVMQGLFLDGVADRIEERHYPELGKPRGAAVIDGMWVAVKVMVLMIVVNLIMLPVYIAGSLLLGAGMALYIAVNGWLCGREYFTQVALRRMSRQDAKVWARANSLRIWLAGTIITLMGIVPVLNLFAPVAGCAFMVHVVRRFRPLAGR